MKRALSLALALAFPALVRADDGRDLFGKKCLACHGADGAGHKPMGEKLKVPDLRKTTLTEAEIERVIADGRGRMLPSRDKMTPEQIAAIAAYVKNGLAAPAP